MYTAFSAQRSLTNHYIIVDPIKRLFTQVDTLTQWIHCFVITIFVQR